MQCPFCQTLDTKVIDSRWVSDTNQIRRRRECIQCVERFTTYETAELTLPRIIKRDGSRSTFDVEKLRRGMLRALDKRPVSADQIEAAINRITLKLQTKGEREIASNIVGELVMQELRALDQVAYVRFASVYRRFEDVEAFGEEIARLKEEPLLLTITPGETPNVE